MKIHNVVLRVTSFYSLITCIRKVHSFILTIFSGPSTFNWMGGQQRFGAMFYFHLQGRKYFLMRHVIVKFCEAVGPQKLITFSANFLFLLNGRDTYALWNVFIFHEAQTAPTFRNILYLEVSYSASLYWYCLIDVAVNVPTPECNYRIFGYTHCIHFLFPSWRKNRIIQRKFVN